MVGWMAADGWRYTRPLARAGRGGLLLALNLLFLLFFLFPFFWQTVTAFESPEEVDALPLHWFPSRLYLGNFHAAIANGWFTHAVLNSLVVATTVTVLALTLGSCAAYALAHLPLPRKRGVLMAILATATLPPIALVPALFLFMRRLGLIDTYAALILADLALVLPFAIWVLANVFRAVPAHLVEQAEVDGCTPVQALRRVVLPLAAPGLVTAGVLSFIMVWNEFLFALTLGMTIRTYTVPVVLSSFAGGGGMLAASSQLVTVPIILIALVCQRGIVQGLTSGAIKG